VRIVGKGEHTLGEAGYANVIMYDVWVQHVGVRRAKVLRLLEPYCAGLWVEGILLRGIWVRLGLGWHARSCRCRFGWVCG
jgi:hypothetical protein